MRRRGGVAVLGILGLAAAGLGAQRASLAYVQADRQPVARLWEEGEKALAAGRPAAALEHYLELLRHAEDDVVPAGPEIYTAVRRAVRRALAALPPALQARARLRQAEAAARLLSRGARPGGDATLWRAFARFPAAAAPALELLGDRAWERGDRALALRTYLRLLETYRPWARPAAIPWPRIFAKTAFLAARAGRGELLARLRREARPDAEAPLAAPGGTGPLGAWLARLRPRPPPPPRPPRAWPTLGGRPDRNARVRVPPPPLRLAWRVTDRVPLSRWEAADLPGPAARAYNPVCAPRPVWAEGVAYFMNGRRLAAFRLADGKLLGEFTFRETNPADACYNPHQYRHVAAVPGLGVFLVTEADPEETNRPTQRVLLAFAPPRDGRWRRRWRRGGPGDPDPVLSRAHLTGSPLVVGGVLYLGGTVRGNDDRVYLFAFRPRDGRLLWRRFLCAGAGRQEDPRFRRVLGELPVVDPLHGEVQVAAADGCLYVSTNMGVVACLERGDGEIRWLYRYPRRRLPQNPSAWPAVVPTPWCENAVVVVGERLLVTPRDADDLLVLWRTPREGRVLEERVPKTALRREYLLLLGAREGCAYLLERVWREETTVFRVAALALGAAPRRRLWTFEVPHAGRRVREYPLGRGLVTDRYVWLPTNKALHCLDRLTGRPVGRVPVPPAWSRPGHRGPGNLVPVPGGLLAAGPTHLACFRVPPRK